MSSSIEIGLRKEGSQNNPYGYIKVENIPYNETCIICLGGDATVSYKEAIGYTKIIENEILTFFDKKLPVYTIKYNFADNDRNISRNLEYSKYNNETKYPLEILKKNATAEDYNPKYIDELFDKIIIQRISKNKSKDRLSTIEACRRIRKITFIAHCHGGYVALKLEEKMQQKMRDLGYSWQERNLIQSQMLVVAHSPSCPLGVSKSQFISFNSVYDVDIPSSNNWFNKYLDNKRKIDKLNYENGKLKEIKNIDVDDDFKPCHFSKKQGNMFLIKQKYPWGNDGPCPNKREHLNVHYREDIRKTKSGNMMSSFGRNIIINGIKNSMLQDDCFIPLPELDKLILSGNNAENERQKTLFEKMQENAKQLNKDIYNYARKTIIQTKKSNER